MIPLPIALLVIHCVLIHGENDEEDGFKGFGKDEWSEVVRNKISKKLQHIPIKISVNTRDGKGCLVLPNKEAATEVQNALKDDFNIEISSKKVYPKMKMFNIDPSLYGKDSEETLKNDIMRKNSSVKSIMDEESSSSVFEVLFISQENRFAVIKVSADVRLAIKNQGSRLYLDMTSHSTRDHLHLTQCYDCQRFGHKSGSPACSGLPVCKYCGQDHASKECPHKNDKDKHACANCLASPHFRSRAHDHYCTDYVCPIAQKEMELQI